MKSWVKGGIVGGIASILIILGVFFANFGTTLFRNNIFKMIYFPTFLFMDYFCNDSICGSLMVLSSLTIFFIWSVALGVLIGWLMSKIPLDKEDIREYGNRISATIYTMMKRALKPCMILIGLFIFEFVCLSLLDYEYPSGFYGSDAPSFSPINMITEYASGGIDELESLLLFLFFVILAYIILGLSLYFLTPKKIKDKISKVSKKKIVFMLVIIILICLLWPKEYYSSGGELCGEADRYGDRLFTNWAGEGGYCIGLIDNFREDQDNYYGLIGRSGKKCLGIKIKTSDAWNECDEINKRD